MLNKERQEADRKRIEAQGIAVTWTADAAVPTPPAPPPQAGFDAAAAPQAAGAPAIETPALAPAEEVAQEAPVAQDGLFARLISGNLVAKVGAVVLFFGVGFLLKFAYDRGLMPPQLRIAGVAALALGLSVLGWRLRNTRRLYGLVIQGVASGLAYLDVYFALKRGLTEA